MTIYNSAFNALVRASRDVEISRNPGREFILGREILINAQYHLFYQVAGNNKEKPLIEGGYEGRNYHNALQCLTSLITLIEVEANIEAIKNGTKPPFGIAFKH